MGEWVRGEERQRRGVEGGLFAPLRARLKHAFTHGLCSDRVYSFTALSILPRLPSPPFVSFPFLQLQLHPLSAPLSARLSHYAPTPLFLSLSLVLFLSRYLYGFYRLPHIIKKDIGEITQETNIPVEFVTRFLSLFTEAQDDVREGQAVRRYIRSGVKNDSLVLWILIATLMVDGFRTNTAQLAQDLDIRGRALCDKYYKQLGCSYKPQKTAKKRKAEDVSESKDDGKEGMAVSYNITLKTPLKFPKKSMGRKR